MIQSILNLSNNQTFKSIALPLSGISSSVTMDNIANLSIAGSVALGGYLSLTANNLSEGLEGIAFSVSLISLTYFGWAIGYAARGRYSKAAGKLAFAATLGGLSHQVFQLSPLKQLQSKIDLLQFRIDALHWNNKLSLNVPRPLRSYPIKQQQAEDWINAHPCTLQRQAAQKFIHGTQHITQEQFESTLKHSVGQFNQWLEKQPTNKYIILTNKNLKKSNRWVTELALTHLKELPENVIDPSRIYSYKERGIRNYVLFDDAAYSCVQMKENLQKIIEPFGIHKLGPDDTIAVIIPYMRDPVCLSKWIKTENYLPTLITFTSKRLPNITEFLTEEESKSLGYSFKGYKATAYFDHKVADYLSVPDKAYLEGKVYFPEQGCPENKPFWQRAWSWLIKDFSIWEWGEYKIIEGIDTKFIDDIIPPYKR
ncbi:MAG: hypothetical protein H0U49_11125 [Parachlamydiaceae bacterium]|nr:hypothetical protein [Parachlamydiaceae bacterium]